MKTQVTLLTLLGIVVTVNAADWPQWRGPGRDGVWSETGIMETFPAEGLKPKWRVKCGPGYSSPIVAGSRVFLTDSVPVRPVGKERMRCFDEATGAELWSHAYEVADWPDSAFDYVRSDDPAKKNQPDTPGVSIGVGPAATPIARDGRLYTLGRAGRLCCFDAAKGGVLWEHDLDTELALTKWSSTPSPLIEGKLLIVFIGGNAGAAVVAFDKDSGLEAWRALNEGQTHSSPIVIANGGERQLIVWTKQSVTALNPATGATRWRERLLTGSDYAVSTPVFRDGLLLVGGLMLRLTAVDAATTLWPDTRAVSHRVLSNTSTAMILGGQVYSGKSKGQFVCLDAATGREVWQHDKVTPLQTFPQSGTGIHLTAQGHSVLIYNDQGELIRAQLSPQGYREISRARIAQPVNPYGGMKLAWAPPAFANGHVFARTEEELVCVSLQAGP